MNLLVDGKQVRTATGSNDNCMHLAALDVRPWLVGLYHAAQRAGEKMAKEVGDGGFARRCREIFASGVPALDKLTWNAT